MILDKTVSVKIYSKNLKRYKEKYKCEIGDVVNILLEDIDKYSSKKVNVECDDCGKHKYLSIQNHNKNKKYHCVKCSMKYKENPFSNPETIKKIKKIKKEKYGENYEKIRLKREKTMIKKYGVKNALENKDIMDKMKIKINNRTEKEVEDIQNKRKKTCSKKYGINYLQIFKEKREKTMIKKYGVKNALENKDIMDKMKIKINNRTDEEKEQILNKHIKTCLKKYGTEFATSNEDVKKKQLKTRILKGYIMDPKNKSDWEIYWSKVRNLTRKNKQELYNNWDGFDYYDNEYIVENLLLNSNNKYYPTIDHKISVYHGFKDNHSPEYISSIENLCITKKTLNSKKGKKNYL